MRSLIIAGLLLLFGGTSTGASVVDPPTREASYQRLKAKIAAGEAVVVHVMLALCDNDNQGIIPVSAALGNGLDLKSNLYWGARYGLKSHFKRSKEWELLKESDNPAENVLERVVFSRSYPNGAHVLLVADAYRGDRMKECIVAFFDAVSGRKQEELKLSNQTIVTAGGADLIVFNGHNGLMDYPYLKFLKSADKIQRETAVIGCRSKAYFNTHLLSAGGYPLLMTTDLMAPEAYVLQGLLDSWATEKDGATIRQSVGAAYHEYQKCGLRGATRLFSTGW
ncbi:MAG: hypothetical protein AAGA31_11130 [Bacteroidota bacterium]